MKNISWFTLCLLLCITAAVSSARADSQTWKFTGTDNPSGAPCSGAAPCGTVNITTSGDFVTFTVTSLLSGYILQDFGFNYAGSGSLAYVSSNGLGNFTQCNGCFSNGWGSFSNNFFSNLAPSGCFVTGGIPGAGCTFTVTLSCAGKPSCSLSDFEVTTSGTNGSGYFYGFLFKSEDLFGNVGNPVPVPVDEPSTLSVMGAGLLGLGGLLRRRFVGLA
jgi:hypothetical protein